jgi:hypothetical protein
MKTSFLLFLAATTALANDTSLHDGRFGPEPLGGGESPVRMMTEHIEVEFGYKNTDVHCTFVFRNTGKKGTVEQLVGFPDIGAAVDEAQRREPDSVIKQSVNTTGIRNLRTFVDGKAVKSVLRLNEAKTGNDPDGTVVWATNKKSGLRAWHTMRVNFPAGQDVTIERRYRVQNGTSALGVAFFHYTTATGAVWKGTIGRLQADVTLRDGLTVDDLKWPGAEVIGDRLEGDFAKYATQPKRTQWQVIDKNHLRMVWTDFEPREQEDRRGFGLSRPFHGW